MKNKILEEMDHTMSEMENRCFDCGDFVEVEGRELCFNCYVFHEDPDARR